MVKCRNHGLTSRNCGMTDWQFSVLVNLGAQKAIAYTAHNISKPKQINVGFVCKHWRKIVLSNNVVWPQALGIATSLPLHTGYIDFFFRDTCQHLEFFVKLTISLPINHFNMTMIKLMISIIWIENLHHRIKCWTKGWMKRTNSWLNQVYRSYWRCHGKLSIIWTIWKCSVEEFKSF